MCGIAGFYGFRNDKLIKKFSKELEHRGPDGEGYYIDDTVSLLNRRLAIIDVKGGDQPIYNEDKSVIVTYNGEIYNYKSLRSELEKKGHIFSTKSDTEVIVHGYEEEGERYFDKLNGMFGIALYDKKKKKLVLARDHFGIKPLYFAFPKAIKSTEAVDFGLVFNSEIKPILNTGLLKVRPNDKVIYRYLKYRVHDDIKETFFTGVYRLMPGQMLIIQNSEFRIQNFSNLENELLQTHGDKKVDEKVITTFKDKLIDAVRLRLISEVPVGSCLSGGLDSSTVVSIVNKLLKEKVKEAKSVGEIQNTFSAVFPNQSNDEEKYIENLTSHISHLKSYKTYPKPEEFFEEIQDFVKTQEEPTVSTGPYAQYKVMELAHKKVTVVLDGQGSDEMMAGYLPYYFVYLRELWKEKKYFKFILEFIVSLDITVKYLTVSLRSFIGLRKTVPLNILLNANFARQYSNEQFIVTNDNLKKRLIEDIFHNSLQSLLRYEDLNAMRFSIEGRVPFLDFNLLRFIFSLNSEAIIKNGWNKYILREATKDVLPSMINRRRNKIGFTTPEHEWFIRMKNKIYSVFLSESFAKRKYFNQKEVLKAFQKFIEGKVDDTMVFWRLLNLELWMREFIDKKSRKLEVRSEKLLRSNEGKKLEIKVGGKTYLRFPITTDLFEKGDDYANKITKSVVRSYNRLYLIEKLGSKLRNKKWFVAVSEKIVAIAQGRSYFIWDIKPSFLANVFSKFVTKTPYGIGLGSPWTMQLAINEIGAMRVLGAAIATAIAKPFGIKGIFYKIAGEVVRSIDGPTEYSLYPSNVSAKLGPKDPQDAAKKIHAAISKKTTPCTLQPTTFLGVVIIDANDLGQNVLGNSTELDNRLIEKIFKDNPMGQANEQTPLTLVFCV